jgi:hypothetical protein
MRKRSLLPVDILLNSLFRDLGISERIRIDALKRQWRTIFAEPLCMHTAPVDLKEGKLIIAVDSPAWLQHLKFLKKEITDKLRPHGIKVIQFRPGSVRIDNERSIPEKMAPPEAFRELTNDDISHIESTIEGIEDRELKVSIRQVMEKAARRKSRS